MRVIRIAMHTVAGLFALGAGFLFLGGLWLIVLGGSWFYAVAGCLLGYVSYSLIKQHAHAFSTAIVLLIFSVIWALLEVGLDYWQFVPRVSLFFRRGLLLLRCFTRSLELMTACKVDARCERQRRLCCSASRLSASGLVSIRMHQLFQKAC